jgi:sporulation protein YlmC with PRC-barrel domain
MERKREKLRISELLSCKIVTAEGKFVGHVVDVQLTPDPPYRVTALLFGQHALLYRLHVLDLFKKRSSSPQMPDRVLWETIDRIEPPTVILKPGRQPEKHEKRETNAHSLL